MSTHHGKITSDIDNSYLIEGVQKYPITIPMHVIPEPATCRTFGCGKTLTMQESLFGDVCINCQQVKRVDIMSVLKFK